MSVAAAFDAVAGEYDAARRRLVPCFGAFYDTVLQLVAEWEPPPRARVLDLGAGTGLLAAMIRAAHPDCVLTLVDLSPAMLDEARRRFAGSADITYEVADYAQACRKARSTWQCRRCRSTIWKIRPSSICSRRCGLRSPRAACLSMPIRCLEPTRHWRPVPAHAGEPRRPPSGRTRRSSRLPRRA